MPAGPGALDAQGIYKYGEADTQALASDLLNLLATAVSTQIALNRVRLTNLEKRGHLANVYVAIASMSSSGVAWADVPGCSVTATSHGATTIVTCSGLLNNQGSGSDRTAQVRLMCDGVVIGEASNGANTLLVPFLAGTTAVAFTIRAKHTPTAASHVWKLQSIASAAAAVAVAQPTLYVEEV